MLARMSLIYQNHSINFETHQCLHHMLWQSNEDISELTVALDKVRRSYELIHWKLWMSVRNFRPIHIILSQTITKVIWTRAGWIDPQILILSISTICFEKGFSSRLYPFLFHERLEMSMCNVENTWGNICFSPVLSPLKQRTSHMLTTSFIRRDGCMKEERRLELFYSCKWKCLQLWCVQEGY